MKKLPLLLMMYCLGAGLLSAQPLGGDQNMYWATTDEIPEPGDRPTDEIKALNQVKSENTMVMFHRILDRGFFENNVLTIASKKGKNNKGKPCFLIEAGTTWKPFDHDIAWFEYEEGYEYKIEVHHVKQRRKEYYLLASVLNKEKKESDVRMNHERNTFENTTWQIDFYKGHENTGGALVFQGEFLGLYTGCNDVRGIRWTVKDDRIEFDASNAYWTELECIGEYAPFLEENLPRLLAKVDRFEAEPRSLKLFQGEELLLGLSR